MKTSHANWSKEVWRVNVTTLNKHQLKLTSTKKPLEGLRLNKLTLLNHELLWEMQKLLPHRQLASGRKHSCFSRQGITGKSENAKSNDLNSSQEIKSKCFKSHPLSKLQWCDIIMIAFNISKVHPSLIFIVTLKPIAPPLQWMIRDKRTIHGVAYLIASWKHWFHMDLSISIGQA